jgi:hypothetical protein
VVIIGTTAGCEIEIGDAAAAEGTTSEGTVATLEGETDGQDERERTGRSGSPEVTTESAEGTMSEGPTKEGETDGQEESERTGRSGPLEGRATATGGAVSKGATTESETDGQDERERTGRSGSPEVTTESAEGTMSEGETKGSVTDGQDEPRETGRSQSPKVGAEGANEKRTAQYVVNEGGVEKFEKRTVERRSGEGDEKERRAKEAERAAAAKERPEDTDERWAEERSGNDGQLAPRWPSSWHLKHRPAH